MLPVASLCSFRKTELKQADPTQDELRKWMCGRVADSASGARLDFVAGRLVADVPVWFCSELVDAGR